MDAATIVEKKDSCMRNQLKKSWKQQKDSNKKATKRWKT